MFARLETPIRELDVTSILLKAKLGLLNVKEAM